MRGILQAVLHTFPMLMMTEENLCNKQELLVHGHHFFYSNHCLTDSEVTF